MRRIPLVVRFALAFLLYFLLVTSLYRVAFWRYFDLLHAPLSGNLVGQALLLGLRFDLRVGLLMLLPLLLLGWLPWLNPFKPERRWTRRAWTALLALGWAGLLMTYVFDAGHYAYLNQRLNASILGFLGDAQISAGMVVQTYPVFRISIAVLAVWILCVWVTASLFNWASRLPRAPRFASWKIALPVNTITVIAIGFLVLLGIMGRLSQYPLRWSDSRFSTNNFAAALSLNPVLNFFDTMAFQGKDFDIDKVRAAYPLMARYLGVAHPDVKTLNYRRDIAPRPGSFDQPYNVVAVYLESFSAYKTSLFGNPLGTTPNFDAIAHQGLLFDRYFTPSFGTARSVFTGLTGIADVDIRDTSSRNPRAVDQYMIANNFADYDKYYMIGGSVTWANIRGLLQNNIDGIHIYEEGSYTEPRNDVWGISDKNLFIEANKVFRNAKKPFFAVVQTSGNHRPYTIPAEDTDFKPLQFTDAQLKANGFTALDEYNSFHYMDWCIGKFIDMAKKEAYFNHTIFVFYGDHGITGDAGKIMPKAWTEQRLSGVHVPLLIYAPALIQPQVNHKIGSEVDLMPTIAGLFNRPYVNTTLGRDLLDPQFDDRRAAFVIWHQDGPLIGVVADGYHFLMNKDGKSKRLVPLETGDGQTDISAQQPAEAAKLQALSTALYETSRYMIVNNHKGSRP